ARQGDAYGIQVGEQAEGFYPAGDSPVGWAQLVALDRKTLMPVSGELADLANKTYPCSYANDFGNPGISGCALRLRNDLKRLGASDLAIVSNQPNWVGVRPYGIESALSQIGVSQTRYSNIQGVLPGSISAIGVPGTSPGEGNWHAVTSLDAGEGKGRMRDYLVRNNEGNYAYAPSDRVEFNTQGEGSSDSNNVIQVADKTFTQRFDGGIRDGGGFQVVVLDPQTLDGRSYWFETDHSSQAALIDQLGAMRGVLHNANASNPRQLVIVASLGMPVTRTSSDAINQQIRALVDEVETLGGTRNAFYTMLDPGLYEHNSYALVSLAKSGGGHGEEAVGTGISGTGTGPLNTVPIHGVLARTGPNYGFEIQAPQLSIATGASATPTGAADPSRGATELARIAFQQPTPWPEQGNAGRTAAIAWIGEQVLGTGDPRGQYWTVAFVEGHFDDTGWGDTASRIGKLGYAQGNGFTEDELSWAKAELQREIGWLQATHRYLGALSTPFGAGPLAWAEAKTIADKILNEVGVSKDVKAEADAKALWDFIRQAGGAIPGKGDAFDAANLVYEMALDLAESDHEPADDDFQVRADDVGAALVRRLGAAQDMLSRQLPNTIAADYGKLKTVGACASDDPTEWPSCPFDHSDWQYTGVDQVNAAKALRPATQIWAYGALLPARFTAYRLPPFWPTKVNPLFHGVTFFGGPWEPFDGLPDSAQMAKPIYRNIPSYTHRVEWTGGIHTDSLAWVNHGETWQITALGRILPDGEGTALKPWQMEHPEATVTDPLFNPVTKGGLGVDPETFFDRNFVPKTLDHYPEQDTLTGWCAEHEKDSVPVRYRCK
ncbi:MAG: hypothetical protein ACRDL1_13340, partial [Solirubrobacterales bacterium]